MKTAVLFSTGLLFMLPCERPPVEYQGESVPGIVLFAHPAIVNSVCKASTGNIDPQSIVLACTNPANDVILLPDPCLFEDNYAKRVCHERAHLRRADGSPGWRHG